MSDLHTWSDEGVYKGAGEQPGSQMSYWREVEMKRRERLLNKQLLEAELATVAAQREATSQAAKQAKYMFWSTIFAAVSAFGALITAVVTYAVAK
jgi:hypothetical protein